MNTWPFQERPLRYAEAWCFGWAFCESLLFIIVPDVALSVVAVPFLSRALMCCVWAVLGTMVGGSLMYLWAHQYPDMAMSVLLALPAIYPEMVHDVTASMQKYGPNAMVLGPAGGIPYKIFAEQAGAMHLPFFQFLLMTIPARIIRNVITCLGFHYVGKGVRLLMGERSLPWVWLTFWTLVYTAYWIVNCGRG